MSFCLFASHPLRLLHQFELDFVGLPSTHLQHVEDGVDEGFRAQRLQEEQVAVFAAEFDHLHELLDGDTVAIAAKPQNFLGKLSTGLWSLLDPITELQVHHLVVVRLIRRRDFVVAAPVDELLN